MKESSPAAEIRYVKTQEIGLGPWGSWALFDRGVVFARFFLFIYFHFSNSNKSVSRRGGGAVETPTMRVFRGNVWNHFRELSEGSLYRLISHTLTGAIIPAIMHRIPSELRS